VTHQVRILLICILALLVCASSFAQTQSSASTTVPQLIRFSGVARDLNNNPLSGVTGITFLLYADQTGGAPLWIETQNVTADKNGHYTVVLGSTTAQGLPTDVFASGEARWLGVQQEGQAEQTRVLLLSVPYALKAVDAQTLGGLPASAFVLAAPANVNISATSMGEPAAAESASAPPPASSDVTTTGGTAGTIPVFTTSTNVQNSILTQTGTSAVNVAGKLNLPATGTATSSSGKDSQGQTFAASAYNSSTSAAVAQTFQLQAEPSGNDTSSPSGTLNVLFASGTSTPAETGLKISNKGLIAFATGQTFPGTGTLTGITTASGSGLSGGGTSGTLSLSIPSGGVTNTMLKDSTVTLNANSAGGLTTPGAMTLGSTYVIGLKPCSTNQILQYSGSAWNCAAASTGTVTSVASGSGLTGGPITSTGTLSIATGGVSNAMLANSSITVKAGTDLTGGGTVSLGGTTTLNLNTADVPQLASANAFTAGQTINGPSASIGLTVDSSGNANDPQVEIIQNNTSDYARLRFTDSGSNNAWDIAGFTETSGSPQLNFWNSVANLNVLQLFPSYAQTNVPVYSYGSSTGLYGQATSTAGDTVGVFGQTDSSYPAAYGVYGLATNSGQGSDSIGVYGQTDTQVGMGVFGQYGSSESVTGSSIYAIGVQGDGGPNGGIGVAGTADEGPAGYFANYSTESTTVQIYSFNSANAFQAGGELGNCTIDPFGDLSCAGSLTGVVHIDGGAHTVGLAAIHSPKNWFEDAGSGQLVNGVAVVTFDSEFLQTVNTGMDYKVFPVPDGDCKGLYITNKTATSFEVHELGGGTSNVAFDYRIMALRKGYENVRFSDLTASAEKHKLEQEKMTANFAHRVSHDPTTKLPIVPPKAQTSLNSSSRGLLAK
jgi:hypothetical protein